MEIALEDKSLSLLIMYLGINAFSHDASAALVSSEGQVIAAVEEERFTRKKKESRFPREAILYCLQAAGIGSDELLGVGLAWHPWHLLFDRVIMEDILSQRVALKHMLKDGRKFLHSLRLRRIFQSEVGALSSSCKVTYFRHHCAHSASAVYGSDFADTAYLTMDGRGERETVTWGHFRGQCFIQNGALQHPNSLGNFYTGFARFCGFHSTDMEGTAMAFAALGNPNRNGKIREILNLPEGQFDPAAIQMDTRLLNCESGDAMPTAQLESHLGIQRRKSELDNSPLYPDVSASVQNVLEECVLSIARRLRSDVNSSRLVVAGGVALNSVANGRLLRERLFSQVFIQPAAHDAGVALGSALLLANNRQSKRLPPDKKAPFFGPEFSRAEILSALRATNITRFEEPPNIVETTSRILAAGKIVGWFQGRLEFGPRALGNRSLLADPRDQTVVNRMNQIKKRQAFRPFAISILNELRDEWLVYGFESPHMLIVDRLRADKAHLAPAAMHVDGSVRTQTVQSQDNPVFYSLLKAFFDQTGVPMLINTSLNVKGEPLACTPLDAIRAFKDSDIDALAIGSFLLSKH